MPWTDDTVPFVRRESRTIAPGSGRDGMAVNCADAADVTAISVISVSRMLVIPPNVAFHS